MLWAQGTEEQRKYFIKDEKALMNFINSSGQLDGFSIYNHSQYTYFDIYLDTPDFDLYKSGLSLRFRKRVFNDSTITYGIQLKSEMETDTSIRMEVEEKELDFYRVKTNSGWLELPKLLDMLFLQVEKKQININSAEFQQAISSIQKWIEFKAESTITPFQKLSHLNGWDTKKIKNLKPVIIGSERRIRSHIYINPINTTKELQAIVKNNIISSVLPEFFKKNADCNWVLETSVDSAVFYPLYKSEQQKAEIYEFEVENKYCIQETGTAIMNKFEKKLKSNFQMDNQIDSKYRQSVKKFLVP